MDIAYLNELCEAKVKLNEKKEKTRQASFSNLDKMAQE